MKNLCVLSSSIALATKKFINPPSRLFSNFSSLVLAGADPESTSDSSKLYFSKVSHPYSLTDKEITESDSKNLFAVIELGGTQYKIVKDDLVIADKIPDIDIGQTLQLEKVLLVGSRIFTHIGHPVVPKAKVVLTVEELVKDHKVIAFKQRRRKNSKRTKGFRRELTVLRVSDILYEM